MGKYQLHLCLKLYEGNPMEYLDTLAIRTGSHIRFKGCKDPKCPGGCINGGKWKYRYLDDTSFKKGENIMLSCPKGNYRIL